MDLDRTSPEWTDHDHSSFRYGVTGSCTVVTKILGNEGVRYEQQTLSNKSEWKNWLHDASIFTRNEPSSSPRLCLLLCGRAEKSFDATWEGMQLPVQYLPFEQHTFVQLVRLFHIHPRITRTIGRECCYFSVQHHEAADEEESSITCTARTSSQLPDDLALSSAFIPQLNLSLAVLYGCSPKQKREAIRRIQACDLRQVHHPLLFAGMLFEMERVRLGDAVDKLLDNFALRGSSSDRDLDLDMDKARMTEFLKSCYESRELVNHIKAVQLQLEKLTAAVSYPNSYISSPSSQPDNNKNSISPSSIETLTPPSTPARTRPSHTITHHPKPTHTLQINPQASSIILARLQDITQELTTKTHDCTLVNSNMSLTMTTAMSHFARLDNQTNLRLSRVNTQLARTNTGLSQDMRRDSSTMKSIAVLTMVFLPMTTVASVFSTGFFTWSANTNEGESVVSGWIWVLAVISVGLTGVVLGIWWWATKKQRGKENDGSRLNWKAGKRFNGANRRMARTRIGMWVKRGRMGRTVRKLRLKGKGKAKGNQNGCMNEGGNAAEAAGTVGMEMDIDLERGLGLTELGGREIGK